MTKDKLIFIKIIILLFTSSIIISCSSNKFDVKLNEKEMLVLKLMCEEKSTKEIADMEDISINTALGRMRYALINLRKLIEKYQLVTDF